MDELLNSLLSSNTIVSIATSAIAFYTAFKLQEEKVKRMEEEQKEYKEELRKIQEKVENVNNEEIKIKIAEIQRDLLHLREMFERILEEKKK